MKMVLVFLILSQGNQESAHFDIVSVLVNINFERNLKKTVKLFRIFFVQCQGYLNYCKVVKGVQNLFELF